ncbi:MAG TPA: hypothetical protein VJA18_01450 [Candidatus Nanoarchaeia archaeon]|nr:hypothetical protein [Candidatus Nanoarchaeia archaeon]
MKQSVLAFIGTVTLESLLGCGYTEFPQYSGSYELLKISYTDPSFMGEKQMPSSLNVVDRMEYIGLNWNHLLQLEFIPASEEQAAGIFTQDLNSLTRIDDGAWPNNWYDGSQIHEEPKVYGPGTWCNRKYLYFLQLESVPPLEVLKNTYPGYTTHMDLKLSLQFPEEVDFDDTEWYDAVEENEGITLHLTFTRYRKEQRPGGEGYQDCILPLDSRGKESLTFTYHASEENLNDRTDIRKERIDSGMKESPPPVIFFRQVVPDIK